MAYLREPSLHAVNPGSPVGPMPRPPLPVPPLERVRRRRRRRPSGLSLQPDPRMDIEHVWRSIGIAVGYQEKERHFLVIESARRQRPIINDDRRRAALNFLTESVPLSLQVLPAAAR